MLKFNRYLLIICISIIVFAGTCCSSKKYRDLSTIKDYKALNGIAVEISQDAYDKKLDFGSKVSFIFFADDLYNKAGVPFIGEKIGTTKLKETVENKKKIAKAIAAYNLSLAGKKEAGKGILSQLNDKDPVVKAISIIFLGKINRLKYSKEIEDAYENEKEIFVKMYALKDLNKLFPDRYRNITLKRLDDKDIFNRTIAASILLNEKPDKSNEILNEALESGNEILACRAMEGLIDKNKLINEELVFSFINDEGFLKALYSCKLLLQADKEKYLPLLKDNLKEDKFPNKLAVSINLLEQEDTSGLKYIKKALNSDNYIEKLYSAKAIIEFYNKTGS